MFQPSTAATTETAKLEVIRLFETEKELTAKRRQKLASIAGVEASAGEALLDSGAAAIEQIAERVLKEKTEAGVMAQAIEVARRRRLAAIQQQFQVGAAVLRRQAAELRAQAEGIHRKAEPLLKKLSDLEAVEYDRSILLAQRVGTWGPSLITGASPVDCSPLEAMRDLDGGFVVPRSAALRNEARALDARAAELEGRQVLREGVLVKSTLEELVAEMQQEPQELRPPVHAVEAWAASCEVQIRKRTGLGSDRPRQYKLQWRDGEIDPDFCSITIQTANYSANQPVFTAAE